MGLEDSRISIDLISSHIEYEETADRESGRVVISSM